MKYINLLFISIPVLQATVNPQTIYEVDGVSQSGRVHSYRVAFKKGDIGNCAVPVISGIPLTTSNYQFDKEVTYPDGTLQTGVVSFISSLTASQALAVSYTNGICNNTGFLDQASMVGFNSGNWGAQILVTAASETVTSDAKVMLNALSITSGQIEYKLQGPIVTRVVVRDTTATCTYCFGWLWNGTTMSDNSGSPYLTTSKIASLMPSFELTFIPSKNIVKVRFILENQWTDRGQDQKYDLVIKVGAALTTVYTKTAFLHIWRTNWTKVFWSGTAPGHTRMDINFDYFISTKLFPNYDRTTAITSKVTSAPEYTDFIASDMGDMGGWALMQRDYAGNEEGALAHKEELRYLYLAGHATQGAGVVNGLAAKAWMILTGDVDANSSNTLVGCTETVAGKGGGLGCGYFNVLMNVPYHLREGRINAAKFYHCVGYESKDMIPTDACSGSVLATGKNISRHAYPGDQWTGGNHLTPVGTYSQNSWDYVLVADHWIDYYYMAALLTGDWYYIEQLYDGAHALLESQNPDAYGSFNNGMFANQSISDASVRSMAWMFDGVHKAITLAPTGSIERTHLTTQMNSNLQMLCGYMNLFCLGITATSPNSSCTGYSGSTANRSAFGRCTLGQNIATGLHSLTTGFSPADSGDAVATIQPSNLANNNGGATGVSEVYFDYFAYLVFKNNIDRGATQFTAVSNEASKLLVEKLLNPIYNPYMVGLEIQPLRTGIGSRFGTGVISNAGATFTWSTGDHFDSMWTMGTIIYIHGTGSTISVGGSTTVLTMNPAIDGSLTGTQQFSYAPPNPPTDPYMTDLATVKAAYLAPVQAINSFTNAYNFPCDDHGNSLVAYGTMSFFVNLNSGTYIGSSAWNWIKANFPLFSGACSGGGDNQLKFALLPRRIIVSFLGGNMSIGGIR